MPPGSLIQTAMRIDNTAVAWHARSFHKTSDHGGVLNTEFRRDGLIRVTARYEFGYDALSTGKRHAVRTRRDAIQRQL